MGIVVSQVMPFPFSLTTPLSREYLAAVQRAGADNKPNYSSMEGYVAAKLFVEGLRRAGRAATRDSLITGLEAVQNLDLGGFLVGYSGHVRVLWLVDLSFSPTTAACGSDAPLPSAKG
jgi:ABC-type branched-subunit amino acid transport system substrate-binding protein